MNKIINFSPNMLKIYEKCPKKFYYKYIEKITIPQTKTPYEKGQKIHALANYFFKGINISRLETSLLETEKLTWERLLNNKYFQMDCIKTEYPLQIKIDNYWIGGRLDAIVHSAYDYYILDYKTGTVAQKPEYDFQTMVYFLCSHRYLEDYKSLTFVYIDLKNNKNVEIKFNSSKKQEYEKILSTMCKNITNEEFFSAKETHACISCEYSKICSSNIQAY